MNLVPGEIWSSPFEVGIVVATGQALQPQHQPMPSADAQRNRVTLIDVAAEAFAERGADASLEEIARHAGVGIGHFATFDRFEAHSGRAGTLKDRQGNVGYSFILSAASTRSPTHPIGRNVRTGSFA